jgi:hypothetical protein
LINTESDLVCEKHALLNIFIKGYQMSYISDVKEGWRDWASSFEWNICGTLTFSANQKPSLAEAQRYWSSFWHKIDRHCYGRSYKNNYHVPRFVYTHQGSGGENPHIHFLTFTPCDTREFCILLSAAVPHQNEILPVRSKEAASLYLQHEDIGYDMSGFNEALTHLPQAHAELRGDALERLASEATSKNAQAAIAAYDMHLERAELRHRRRNAFR